jgi:hypothetical protein
MENIVRLINVTDVTNVTGICYQFLHGELIRPWCHIRHNCHKNTPKVHINKSKVQLIK